MKRFSIYLAQIATTSPGLGSQHDFPVKIAGPAPLFGPPLVVKHIVTTSVLVLIVVIAAIHFWSKRSLPELDPGRLYDIAFWVSAISIIVLAAYGLWTAIAASL